MSKLYTFILLASGCMLQGMEEDASNTRCPYSKREEIGSQVSRIIVDDQYFTDGDAFLYAKSITELNNFYIFGSRLLRRIPRIAADDGLLEVIKQAFKAVAEHDHNSAEIESNKDQSLERLLFPNERYRETLEQAGIAVNNIINEGLPLFLHPDVKVVRKGPDVYLNRGNTEILFGRAGKIFYDNGRVSNDAYRFFVCATPLQYLAMIGGKRAWQVMEWLIELGANPSAITSGITRTPLQLLIDTAHWEQGVLGEQGDLPDEVIKAKKVAAERFITNEWNRMVEQQRPTILRTIKQNLPDIKTCATLMVILLFFYYQLYYSAQSK